MNPHLPGASGAPGATTNPEQSGCTYTGNEQFDLPTSELNLLIKLLPSVKMVSYHDVGTGPKAQRLTMWRNRNRTVLASTRGVVVSWWDHLWATAEPLYKQWARSMPADRLHVRCGSDVPVRFMWIDQHMRPRLLETLPKKVQTKVRSEEQFGPTRSCAQMVFMLLQDQGPGDLHDIDEVSRHVRSPAPCSDPAAALTELRRWWASLQRLKELQIALPDVRELYRACLSIFDTILAHHADPEVQHR